MWPLERTQGFSKIQPSDLVFNLKWPTSEVVRDFIKTNILTKFHEYRTENVASIAYSRKKLTLHDTHNTITKAHSEHFVLRGANNLKITDMWFDSSLVECKNSIPEAPTSNLSQAGYFSPLLHSYNQRTEGPESRTDGETLIF